MALQEMSADSREEERRNAAVEAWLHRHGFDATNLLASSVSNGNRCYPHSFRDVWYSSVASTALMEACATSTWPVILYILEKCPESLKFRDEFGNTALHLALERGHCYVARYLLEEIPLVPLSIAQRKNALGSSPAMLSTRSPSSADCAIFCLVHGLFDEPSATIYDTGRVSTDKTNFSRLDQHAISIALQSAQMTTLAAIKRWISSQAIALSALQSALYRLIHSPYAPPLLGVGHAVEPLIRAYLTAYDTDQIKRILSFYDVLYDLGFLASALYHSGNNPHPTNRRRRRQSKKKQDKRPASQVFFSEHPMFSR